MIELPASDPERSPERDGCDCPPWVERCIHFNGDILMVVRRAPANNCLLCGDERQPGQSIGTLMISGRWSACEACGDLSFRESQVVFDPPHEDNHEAALAAFHAAEARLLGRDL